MTLELTKDRELVAKLLNKTTRVQLGDAIFDSLKSLSLLESTSSMN